jgi:hypothetical protein
MTMTIEELESRCAQLSGKLEVCVKLTTLLLMIHPMREKLVPTMMTMREKAQESIAKHTADRAHFSRGIVEAVNDFEKALNTAHLAEEVRSLKPGEKN